MFTRPTAKTKTTMTLVLTVRDALRSTFARWLLSVDPGDLISMVLLFVLVGFPLAAETLSSRSTSTSSSSLPIIIFATPTPNVPTAAPAEHGGPRTDRALVAYREPLDDAAFNAIPEGQAYTIVARSGDEWLLVELLDDDTTTANQVWVQSAQLLGEIPNIATPTPQPTAVPPPPAPAAPANDVQLAIAPPAGAEQQLVVAQPTAEPLVEQPADRSGGWGGAPDAEVCTNSITGAWFPRVYDATGAMIPCDQPVNVDELAAGEPLYFDAAGRAIAYNRAPPRCAEGVDRIVTVDNGNGSSTSTACIE